MRLKVVTCNANPKFFQSQLQTFKTEVQTWWGGRGGVVGWEVG